MGQGGKRVGPRKRRSSFDAALLGLALGVTLLVVAWGYLVKAAIDFGTSARSGEPAAWAFLGLASLGAVACLFVGLMLVARITRRLGITRDPEEGPLAPVRRIELRADVTEAAGDTADDTAEVPVARLAGGRRAAR
ncbi:hypothetical protein ACFP3Q_14340 [Nocardioides sp. GCM10027113]|uniref:hypothetical protein n=1 Tax=unclassified Nocardioides TaxID=2615069 RepID=UPI00360F4D01